MNDRPTKKSRTIASQACDSCRQRKIRCDFSNAKDDQPGQPRVCRGCEDVGIPCTFDMPVKRRGPPSKLSKANSNGHDASPTERPSANISSPRQSSHVSHASVSSAAISPFPAGLLSPYDVGNGVQLPPIQDQAPTLFHLRYAGRTAEDMSNHVHPTDRICPRPMFEEIMQDYLDMLYPLVPVVHKPTFLDDLKNRRELYDASFLSLITAIAATVVAHVPSRFYYYCSKPTPLRFAKRAAMVDFCYDYILSLRRTDTFDEPTHTLWATSYLLSMSYIHLGYTGGRMLLLVSEWMQMANIIELYRPPPDGTSQIERQLRLKAFWLSFFGYVHSQVDVGLKQHFSLWQPHILETLNFDHLLPLELDDEFIHAHSLSSQPHDLPSLTIGFNANCRIFWAAVTGADNRIVIHSTGRNSLPLDLQVHSLQTRLQRVKHALDNIHPQVSRWNVASPTVAPDDIAHVRDSMWESMRANIHVGHLWLQSCLFEHLVATLSIYHPSASASCPSPLSSLSSRSLWNEREDICRQLLHILYNISAQNLEPNGSVLVNKIRAVATTMLDCPVEAQGDVVRRANGYISHFAELLARIDVGVEEGLLGREVWEELDDYGRRGVGDFSSVGGSTGTGNGI